MPIFFNCECGNSLKAREEMAGRYSFCPRCGNPVRIPALEATHSGIERAPASEDLIARGSTRVNRSRTIFDDAQQDRGAISQSTENSKADFPFAQLIVRKSKKRKRKKKRKIEFEGWGQRLIFPLRDYRFLLALSGYITLTGSLFLFLFPDSQQNEPVKHSLRPLVWGGTLPFFTIGLAYCAAMFNRVLFFTLVRDGDDKSVPKLTFSSAIDSFLFWVVAFFAGPFVLLLLALVYWIYCGQIDIWNTAIIGELLCGGIAWWILTVLGNSQRLQNIPLNPVHTFRALKWFGWKAVIASLFVCPILVGTGLSCVFAASQLERNPFLGVSVIFAVSFLVLYVIQIALRTIGISYFKTRSKADLGNPQ